VTMVSPVWVLASLAALTAATAVLGLWLRGRLQRLPSLRATVLTLSLSALVLAFAAAAVASRLMLIRGRDLLAFLVVVAVAAGFVALLTSIVSRPLVADVARLGAVAEQVEHGDLSIRTGIDRRDELGHAAHALDQLVGRLAELEAERSGAEAERRAMLTSISHDLRTPLTALSAALEALVDGVAPDPDRYLRSMGRDVSALTSLIDDLFVLARIEAGQRDVDHRRLDLAELADEAVEALAPEADRHDVRLVLSAQGEAPVVGSASELGRVVRNLLDNAIRHSPPGGVVRCDVTTGERVRVAVSDDGDGFPADFVDAAFEPFSRADRARGRTTGGAGLGLAIARGLVGAHGGTIAVCPGPGGRVTVEIPSAARAGTAECFGC